MDTTTTSAQTSEQPHADLAHLAFLRWLVQTGRLNDHDDGGDN